MNIKGFFLGGLLLVGLTSVNAQSQVTVCDGTDYNAYAPFCGFGNMDGDQTSQMIYPASMLASLEGKNITGMIFYPRLAIDWTTVNKWSMTEVDQTAFTDKSILAVSASEVANTVGEYDSTEETWTITFDSPYTYNGGNLLIQGMMPKAYNGNKTFYGVNQTDITSVTYYNNMGFGYETATEKFLPKVTFICEDAPLYLELGDVVLYEPFETYADAFTTSAVGEWKYIDADGWSTYSNPNMGALPHAGEAMAYQLIDTSDSRYTAYYRAHGGSKFLMAMGAKDGIVNNDWLISPELNLTYGGKLSFWAMGATGYATFMVLASTTDASMDSFAQVGETFTKLGGSWTEYGIELPMGTKYFAIRNITDCGGWLAIPFSLDDISVNEYVVSAAINGVGVSCQQKNNIYNLQGVRVTNSHKGIVVGEGRKYISK